jgi:arylsulfatase A-like enzyme
LSRQTNIKNLSQQPIFPSLVTMKQPAYLLLAIAMTFFAGWTGAMANTLLDDHFNNGALTSNPDIGGGFGFIDNGVNPGTGSVSESGSQARILEGTGSNTSGILSTNAFNLADPGLTYTVTWQVAGWTSAGSGTGTRRTFFTLQSNNSWLFSTAEAEASRIFLTIDEGGNFATLTYQNRSVGNSPNPTNFISGNFALDGTFAGDPDGFTITLVMDATGYRFTTAGLANSQQINLTGSWASLSAGTTFATALGTDGPVRVGAFIQDTTTTSNTSRLDIDRITLAASSGVVAANLSADSSTVAPGTTVQLSWTASDYDTLTLDPGGINAAALTSGGSGSTNVVVNASTTYTLTASRNGQSVSSQAIVNTRTPASGPNVLVVLIDDMGITDTSVPFVHDASGNPVITNFNNFYVTPNMQTLAARGMKFTSAYATPACSPTRASLMTGLNTMRHGVSLVVNPNGVDPNRVSPLTDTHRPPNDWKRSGFLSADAPLCMPSVLRNAGYRTIHVGKGHFGSIGSFAANPTALGFDINVGGSHAGQPASYTGNYGVGPGLETYSTTNTFLTDALTREMNKAIEKSVDDGLPFFAYLAHYAAHTPFTTDPNATGNYSTGISTDHRRFASLIEGMDQSLGSVLAKLEQLGVADDTLVIFLGDNGSDSPAVTVNGLASGTFNDFPLRGKKATAWEGGTRVPMLVSWALPNAANPFQSALPIAPGSREDDIVAVWDIFPTILGISGVTPPQALDGYDLSAYLRGTPGTHRPQQLLNYWPGDHYDDFFATYRDGNWKLTYRFAPNTYELYDLTTDPTESNNRAASEPQRVMTMARAMARQFEAGWGPTGRLWPTFLQAGERPFPNDPLLLPTLPTVDTDADGIPDNQEDPDFNGLVGAGETKPDAPDSDQDGTFDGVELRTGTDPLNPASFFRVTPSIAASGRFLLSWPSKPGAVYKIESSTTLQGTWTTVTDNVPAHATGTTTTLDVGSTLSPERKFFRVSLKD